MAFKFKITRKPDWRTLDRKLAVARDAGELVMAERIGQRILEEVKRRIPNKGGWLAVYRDSLRVEVIDPESGSAKVRVTSVTDTKLSTVPAENTAIFIEGDSAVAMILKQYNPWPVDVLPAIRGGASADIRLVPSSLGETTKLRAQRADNLVDAKALLSDAGFTIVPGAVPHYNGRTYFDFAFMAKRLEYGLGPFAPTPHWKPGVASVAAQADRIVSGIAREVEAAMKEHL